MNALSEWIQRWRVPFLSSAAFACLGILIWRYSSMLESLLSDDEFARQLAWFFLMVFCIFGFALVVTFFWIFRGIDADKKSLSYIITYCYAFIAFAISTPVLPFMVMPHVKVLESMMTQGAIGFFPGCSIARDKANSDASSDSPKDQSCQSHSDQWVVNIGGLVIPDDPASSPDPLRWGTSQVNGGLVVPLYVVVLALMGAAVSMTRRVPEVQRRLSPGDPEYISHDQAREILVCQIMQVASSPLIALTAYYLVAPNSQGGTIALGFASGFSSETILLLIRATLDKIKPVAHAPAAKPASVRILPARLEFGDVSVGQSIKKSLTVSNAKGVDFVIAGITCTGEFSFSANMPITVSPGSGESIEIEFKPATSGSKAGLLTIVESATGSLRAVELAGVGV